MRKLLEQVCLVRIASFNLEIQEVSWNVVGDIAPLIADSHLLCGENSDIIIGFDPARWSLWVFPQHFIWPLIRSSNHQI